VTVVVHGHAHNGTIEGRTAQGVPVYNVAMPLLKKLHPDALPVRIIEIDPDAPAVGADGGYAGVDRRQA